MSESALAYTLFLSGFGLAATVAYWRGIASAVPLLLLEPVIVAIMLFVGFNASGYTTCSPSFQASEWLLSNRLSALGVPIEGNVGQFTLGMIVGITLAIWPRLRRKHDIVMGVSSRPARRTVMVNRIRTATRSRVERGGWLD